MSVPSSLLNPQTAKLQFPFHLSSSPNLQPLQNLRYPKKVSSFTPSIQSSFSLKDDDDFEELVIGDCLVFEEGAFEDPYLDSTSNNGGSNSNKQNPKPNSKNKGKKKDEVIVTAENLVPDKWREVQAEINITKKERRKIAQEMEFNSRVDKKKKGLLPIRSLNLEEYKTYREAKLAQLNPLVLDNPSNFAVKEEEEDGEEEEEVEMRSSLSRRVAPKNPRWAVYGKGFDDVTEFFNTHYEPGAQKPQGPRKLFTKEEKALLNKKMPDLTVMTSRKWLPLHSLAASGEFYLVDALLKHNVDINAVNLDGMTALSKAILCKKQAITNYLLRESASPFVQDEDGATLMHYAVQTANVPAIKILLLYNVDINLQDNDGWTPLHVAVQARRTDVIKLLLIKGADRTLKNKDGLTPVDLCLYSGRNTRTCELIKLLKQFPKKLMKSIS